MFSGGTDVEAETPILWPPDVKRWLLGKDPDAGKDWRQEEKGMTEDEMVGWHHRLNRHGFGWTPGVGDGQGGLVCCGSWGRKELDTIKRLNWTELSDKTLEKDIEAFQLLLRRHSVKAKKPEHWLTVCQKNIILLPNLEWTSHRGVWYAAWSQDIPTSESVQTESFQRTYGVVIWDANGR